MEPTKQNRALPEAGASSELLLSTMRSFHAQDAPRWSGGQQSGTVYHGEPEHLAVQDAAFELFSVSNPLHADVWPSVVKFEAEVIAMTAALLGGGEHGARPSVCGAVTSGGTESVFMATKAHRQWAERELGVAPFDMEIICADSAHAAIDKACDILRIKLVKIPVDPVTFQADVAAFRAAVRPGRTIMLYASAPNYPQGAMDPIGELGALATEHGIGLHVDCCLGGFFLPFMRRLSGIANGRAGGDFGSGHEASAAEADAAALLRASYARDGSAVPAVPAFDFAVAGVTSMSADTHKYGYATKGTSVVLFHAPSLRDHMFFLFPKWSGGVYATPTTAGSRAGALSAACWASMMKLGREGYMRCTALIARATHEIAAGVGAIPGLRVLVQPVGMVIAFAAAHKPGGSGGDGGREPLFNIYRLSDAMSKRGWGLSQCQHPACLHVCVTLRHAQPGRVQAMLQDMRECTAAILADPGADDGGQGAAIYGLASSLPTGELDAMLTGYLGKVLDVPEAQPEEEAQPEPESQQSKL